MDNTLVQRLRALAHDEGWVHYPAGTVKPSPSTSEAIRRLVVEALNTREAGSRNVTIGEGGWKHAQRRAKTADVDTREMVRRMLQWAADNMPHDPPTP